METLPPKTPLKPAIKIDTVLRKQTDWKNLWFYQKTVVLYRMTYVFTRRYFPTYGDRTVDQMVQAARSGKQNIVEGSADGVTSMELEMKLLNVARSSIQELLEDYEDYLPRERMTAARLGYRTNQRETIEQLTHEVGRLKQENEQLKKQIQ